MCCINSILSSYFCSHTLQVFSFCQNSYNSQIWKNIKRVTMRKVTCMSTTFCRPPQFLRFETLAAFLASSLHPPLRSCQHKFQKLRCMKNRSVEKRCMKNKWMKNIHMKNRWEKSRSMKNRRVRLVKRDG